MTAWSDPAWVGGSPLGRNLTAHECELLARKLRHRTLHDEQLLIREGQVTPSLFVVLDGRLVAYRIATDGETIELQRFGPGDIVGELGFIDDAPPCANVRADGPVALLQLDRSAFEELLTEAPTAVYQVMRNIVATVHGILRRMNLHYAELTRYIAHQHDRR